MDGLGFPLVIIGGIIAFIGGIRLIIEAFSAGVLWGLAVIFIHPLMLIFVLLHWSDAKGPFMNYLVGVVIMIVGAMLSGG